MNQTVLSWDKPTVSNPSAIDTASYYSVYKFRGTQIGDISNPANIFMVTKKNQISISRKWAIFRKKFVYVVTAFDRMHNESNLSQPIIIKQKVKK